MKKKRRIVLLILLLIFIIIEIIAFTSSKANKIIVVTACMQDDSKNLDDENLELNATYDDNKNYYIILPEVINGKKVLEYTVENTQGEEESEKVDNGDENTENVESESKDENNVNLEGNESSGSDESAESKETTESKDKTTKVTQSPSSLTKKPGEKVYLSKENQENKKINISVKYDTKAFEDTLMYNKIIEKEIDGKRIRLEGYMPVNAEAEVKKVEIEQIEEELSQFLLNNVNFEIAYDITIKNGDKEYNPEQNNEKIEVTIFDAGENEKSEYRVVHIDEKETKDVENVENDDGNIKFSADNFSIYAVLEEVSAQELMTYKEKSNVLVNARKWDGTVAEGFKFGDGSKENPYLISTGEELAYLANSVNNGTYFENQYFQLASDIDLNGKAWTPIGNTNNSFRGNFDGAGHIISNGHINVNSVPSGQIDSYGIFGSLGGGNSKAIIKNLEISDISVNIGGGGDTSSNNNTKGWHIGTLVGTMYRNSEVINNIAKNCSISDNGNVRIYNSSFQYSVGGLVGYATNTQSSTSDPGASNRYKIENCFVNTNINLSNEARSGIFSNTNDAQYHTGGIVGTIRSQAVWPEGSLYVGTINSNGFIGPIFGALMDSTSTGNRRNFDTLWNGNDAGNLTMTSYYSSFSANGTAFNRTVTSGNSNNRLSSSYRDIGYVQGVNKGIYESNISNLLSNFNNYAGSDYIKWKFENGTFSFVKRFETTLNDTNKPIYKVEVNNEYSSGPYTYTWYLNGNLVPELQDKDQVEQERTWDTEYNYTVLVGDGTYFSILNFTVERFSLEIEFDIDEANNRVTARLVGEALEFINLEDYEYQWYKLDIAGMDEEEIEGATSLTLDNLENGQEYKLFAKNTKNYSLNVENSFVYGDRNVVYVNYDGGSDSDDGKTPETAVRTIETAYGKLDSQAERNENIIVIMGTYSDRNYFNYDDESGNASRYKKNATFTGIYGGVDYNATLYLYSGTSSYRYLNADTTFQYLDFYGGNNQLYFYLQGYSLTIGEGVTMRNYANSNQNQGLLGGNAPAFHIICGWCQYNYTTLPRNNPEIVIKSGTYARIIGGGSPGTSSGQGQENSHDFMGSSKEDTFNIEITIDIKNSTTASEYDYDVNLLTGGSACGNNYSNVTENIKNGTVGRVLGGSIGDSQNIPTEGGWWDPQPWKYPNNTFLGETTINVTGGTIAELYGGCLGRNMGVVDNGGNIDNGYSGNTCDSYFYGKININILGGTITKNIYGAGAGGVTGYSENSSDPYKTYGAEFDTSVNINISGGTISGNVYGGGYGYTEYLNANVTAEDGGSLYGSSNVVISGSPTINGDIYAAGCGYDMPKRPNLAQMEGDSSITISGTPTINGQVFAAGAGLSQYSEMAKLTGNTNTTIQSDITADVYGGGNNAKTVGTTNVNIENGTHQGDIYGGGNLGVVEGTANVNINGGTPNRVFGGGNQAQTDTSNVYINGGNANEVYAGGNSASVNTTNTYIQGGNTNTVYCGSNQTGTVQNSNVFVKAGTTNTIYGGNNVGGVTQNSKVTIEGGNVTDAVYGGGNRVNTTNAEVYLISSENPIHSIYGGGNMASVENPKVYIQGGEAEDVFGGSNNDGTINNSFVEVTGGHTENVYGGNNNGGTTQTTNVNILSGEVNNVFGGGNKAITTETNVNIKGNVLNDVYAGGNEAEVTTNTNLNIEGGNIQNNAYGGGNEGTVASNTYVHAKNATLGQSLYAGGNGAAATVFGNTNLVLEGTGNQIGGSVFGGGNKAATGTEDTDNSVSTVNIVGGNIAKNVYGGANTSVVYGITKTNIGYDAVKDTSLEKGNINIGGTVFGGGEANADGDEDYDFSFISVTKGIDINIDGNGHEEFEILGSIFGSGNASSTSGYSYINVSNYGTADEPKSNISIQRTNCLTMTNSAIALSGATDRTNEYSDEYYTLSRVDTVKLQNNSTLYLNYGANLLKELKSILYQDGQKIKGAVTIDEETGAVTKNVDNRIYMAEGKNLNIATNEQATAYGTVDGMIFLGLFTNKMNPSTSTGLYNPHYQNGDEITNAGTFSSNSYAMAQHMENHDTSIDGFYTNYNEEGFIKVNYIGVTPENDVYYMWLVGEQMDVTTFEVSLSASKYATLGTYELSLTGFSEANTKYNLVGFSAGLDPDVSLIDPDDIENIASNEEDANNIFGLTMETGNNGWSNKGLTTFFTEDGGSYEGSSTFIGDNSTFTPSFNFCLFHSANITEEKLLGDVRIRLQAMIPVDDLNYKISYIDIIITMTTALYQDEFYEAAITPGEEYGLFTSTSTSITDKSAFSTYYSLYLNEFSNSKYYDDFENNHRVLVSTDSNNNKYCFPAGTRMVMLDLVTDKEYYYVVTQDDVLNNKSEYRLSDFIAMGSTNEHFDESQALENYYNSEQDILYENFVFHIKFSEAEIDHDIENNSLLIELRDNNDETLLGVLGIERDIMKYNVYKNKDSVIEVSGKIDDTAYLGSKINLEVTTDFKQQIMNSMTIFDTEYFEDKMGIMITIYDSSGNQLALDSLFGVNFELDGEKYYPRIDGTTRIKIADKVSNVLSKIKIDTTNNKTLATGTYTVKVETFGSPDGVYFGLESSASMELKTTIINSSYGLNLTTDDAFKIIDDETGKTLNGSTSINAKLQYSSGLENPKIVVALYRRSYDDVYSNKYELVDLADYFTNLMTETDIDNEYLLTDNPAGEITTFWNLKSDLKTGTYKLVYKLYDSDKYIGEDSEYFIIK